MTWSPARATPPPRLPPVVGLMAFAAGMVAANLHYSQPLLPVIAESLGVDPVLLGAVPALTQLGFAVSLLLVLPIADSVGARALVLVSVGAAAVALWALALAPGLPLTLVAATAVGVASIAPQVLSPFAAAVAPATATAHASGLVLSGILLGVLLSRLFAGVVTAVYDWRVLYGVAGAFMLALLVVLRRALPASTGDRPLRTTDLVSSPVRLLRAHRLLRRSALLGALASGAFMLFWSSYALQLFEQFGYGPLTAGLFGIAGVVGSALASPAGRWVDRGRATPTLAVGAGVIACGFGVLAAGVQVLACYIVGIVLIDAGVAVVHATSQGRTLRIDARRRAGLNSVYMFAYFLGGACGSALGLAVFGAAGWIGVCLVGAALGVAMIAIVAADVARPLRDASPFTP